MGLPTVVLAQVPPTDPYRLPIGAPGLVDVIPGAITDLRLGRRASVDELARAADGFPFLLLGESHDVGAHHQAQADVIEALVRRGRSVTVGFEMFTRPNQANLNPWTLGWWNEAEFIAKSEWKSQWGFDYALYRPIFEVVRRHRLPMVAMNVPRDWVRAVGRGGYEALTPEQRAQLPADLYLGNRDHRAVFDSLMGGHPPTGAAGERIYAAQVLWDEAMADTAIDYLASRAAGPRGVFVVIAGSGHVMYGQGIGYRIHRRTRQKSLTVVMIEGDQPRSVSRGLADFVYMAPPVKRALSPAMLPAHGPNEP